MHMVLGVVYKSERRHRTRAQTEMFFHTLLRGERQFSLFQTLFQIMYGQTFFTIENYQIMAVALFVAEKQVFTMFGAVVMPQPAGDLYRRGFLMVVFRVFYTSGIEVIVNRFFPFFTFHSQCAKPFFICTTCLFSSSNVSVCTRTAYLPDARNGLRCSGNRLSRLQTQTHHSLSQTTWS